MILKTTKRAISEIRQQPLIGALTIFGTAFAVFLAMVVMMTAQVKLTPFAPESCRDRLFLGKYMHTEAIEANSATSSGMSYATARTVYGGLEGVDTVSYIVELWEDKLPVQVNGETTMMRVRYSDAAFWTVFDHTFLAGRPFSDGAFESALPEVVLSRSAAGELFGVQPADAVGRTMVLADKEATVVGVVEDVTPLAKYAYGEVYGNASAFHDPAKTWGNQYHGNWYAAIVAKPGTTQEQLREQVRERYRRLEAEMKPQGLRPVYHQGPFTLEEDDGHIGSNTDPSGGARSIRYVIYLMLILIPAINLSSITHSRLRHRVAEIGVRRAFGANRARIFADLVAENFIVTLIGSAVGLVLSFIVVWACADFLLHLGEYGDNAVFSPMMLVDWATVGFALLIAFVLNLLSAGIPAIQAARVNPVNAISGHHS